MKIIIWALLFALLLLVDNAKLLPYYWEYKVGGITLKISLMGIITCAAMLCVVVFL